MPALRPWVSSPAGVRAPGGRRCLSELSTIQMRGLWTSGTAEVAQEAGGSRAQAEAKPFRWAGAAPPLGQDVGRAGPQGFWPAWG